MAQRPLDGKVAIVTGAASPIGLGRSIALALAGAGARIAMVDIDRAALDERLVEMRGLVGRDGVIALVADTGDPAAAENAVKQTIAELGGLHIVVNNAGMHHGRAMQRRSLEVDFWEVPIELWSRIIAVNLSGPFFMARAAAGHLRAQKWGRISFARSNAPSGIRLVLAAPPGTSTLAVTPLPSRSCAIVAIKASCAALEEP